jgi:hypothetical protein
VSIVLFLGQFINWTLIPSVILVVFGAWFLVLAAMRGVKTQKHERSSFSTFILGLLLVAFGGAWFLFGINWLYSVVLVLVILAAVAIVAATRRK